MATKSAKRSARRPVRKPAKRKPAKRAAVKRAGSASSQALARRAAEFLRFARKMVDDMAAGIPDERATEQIAGAYNHKTWTIGHLGDSNAWFASLIDGRPVGTPPGHESLFGMSSKPVADAGTYPSLDELRAHREATFNRLVAAVEALTDDELLNDPLDGDGAGFVNDKFDSALKAAWHEGWHLGQIAALRKGLGLPPLFGRN